MAFVYTARSVNLCRWASDVGLGKHVFKLGVADDKAAAGAAILAGWAGETDWKLVAGREAEATEDEAIAHAAQRDKMIDPGLYPRIRGTTGLFRLTELAVLNAMLIGAAAADGPLQPKKPKPKDFGEHLLRHALD